MSYLDELAKQWDDYYQAIGEQKQQPNTPSAPAPTADQGWGNAWQSWRAQEGSQPAAQALPDLLGWERAAAGGGGGSSGFGGEQPAAPVRRGDLLQNPELARYRGWFGGGGSLGAWDEQGYQRSAVGGPESYATPGNTMAPEAGAPAKPPSMIDRWNAGDFNAAPSGPSMIERWRRGNFNAAPTDQSSLESINQAIDNYAARHPGATISNDAEMNRLANAQTQAIRTKAGFQPEQMAQGVGNVLGWLGGVTEQIPSVQGLKDVAGAGLNLLNEAQVAPRVGGTLMQASDARPNYMVAALGGIGNPTGATYQSPQQIEQALKGAQELKTTPPLDLAKMVEKAPQVWAERTPLPVQIAFAFIDPSNALFAVPARVGTWGLNTYRAAKIERALSATPEIAAQVIADAKAAGLSSKGASRVLKAADELIVPDLRAPEQVRAQASEASKLYANVANTKVSGEADIATRRATLFQNMLDNGTSEKEAKQIADQFAQGLRTGGTTPYSVADIFRNPQTVVQKLKSMWLGMPTPTAMTDQTATRASTIIDTIRQVAAQGGEKDAGVRAADIVTRLVQGDDVTKELGALAKGKAATELRTLMLDWTPQTISNKVAAAMVDQNGANALRASLHYSASRLFPAPVMNPAQHLMAGYRDIASKPFMDWNPGYFLRNYYTNVGDGLLKEGIALIPGYSAAHVDAEMARRGMQFSDKAGQGIGAGELTKSTAAKPYAKAGIGSTIAPQVATAQTQNAAQRAGGWLKQGMLKASSEAESTASKVYWYSGFDRAWKQVVDTGKHIPQEFVDALKHAGFDDNTMRMVVDGIKQNGTNYGKWVEWKNANFAAGKEIEAWRAGDAVARDALRAANPAIADQVELAAMTAKTRVEYNQALTRIKNEYNANVRNMLARDKPNLQADQTYKRVVDANLARSPIPSQGDLWLVQKMANEGMDPTQIQVVMSDAAKKDAAMTRARMFAESKGEKGIPAGVTGAPVSAQKATVQDVFARAREVGLVTGKETTIGDQSHLIKALNEGLAANSPARFTMKNLAARTDEALAKIEESSLVKTRGALQPAPAPGQMYLPKKGAAPIAEKTKKIPLDLDGNELVDMNGTPIELNKDGTITLYHRTSADKARELTRTGQFKSLENTDETFFSNKLEGQAEGYGDVVVAVKVRPSQVRINDAFRNGEIHVAASNKLLSKRNIVQTESVVKSLAPNLDALRSEALAKGVDPLDASFVSTEKELRQLIADVTSGKTQPYAAGAAPMNQARDIAAIPRGKLPDQLSSNMEHAANQMVQDLHSGQPGGRTFLRDVAGQGGTPEIRGYSSTYPDWYSELVAKYNTKKDTVENALRKIIADEGKDKGITVERVKASIIERLAKGVEGMPPDPQALELLNASQAEIDAARQAWKAAGYDIPAVTGAKAAKAAAKPAQAGMFKAGEETPLFSGTPQRVQGQVFKPQERPGVQGKMFSTAPEMKGAKKVGGKPSEALGGAGTWAPDPVPAPSPRAHLTQQQKDVLQAIETERARVSQSWGATARGLVDPRAALDAAEQAVNLQGRLAEAYALSSRVGDATRNFILHDYVGGRMNLDTLIAYAIPWNYWYTREGWTYAQTIFRQPGIIAAYQKYRDALAEVNADLPQAYKDSVQLGPDSLRLYTNLANTFLPFETHARMVRGIVSGVQDTGENQGISSILQGGVFDNFNMYPGMEYAWNLARGTRQRGEQTGEMGTQTAQARLIKGGTAALKQQFPQLPIQPGGFNPEEAAAKALTYGARASLFPNANISANDPYEIGRIADTLTEMLRAKEITQQQYDQAVYSRQGKTWDEATNRSATRGFLPDVTSALTGVRVRQMPESTAEITAAKRDAQNTYATLKEIDPSSAESSQVWQQFKDKYPWYFTYTDRYGTPEERTQAYQTNEYYRAKDGIDAEFQKRLDAARANQPIGATVNLDSIYAWKDIQYNALRAQNSQASITYNPATKSPRQLGEKAQSDTLNAVLQQEPKWDKADPQWGGDYAKYQAAHDRWQQNIPQMSADMQREAAQRGYGNAYVPVTAAAVEAYRARNATPITAANAVWFDYQSKYYDALDAAVAPFKKPDGTWKDHTSAQRKAAEANVDVTVQPPTIEDLIAAIQARPEYKGKWTDTELQQAFGLGGATQETAGIQGGKVTRVPIRGEPPPGTPLAEPPPNPRHFDMPVPQGPPPARVGGYSRQDVINYAGTPGLRVGGEALSTTAPLKTTVPSTLSGAGSPIGILTAQQRSEAKQTPEQKQVDAISNIVYDVVPYGQSGKFSEDLNAAMKKAGFVNAKGDLSKDYAQLWYDTNGKGLKPDELVAMEKAAQSVADKNNWKPKTRDQLQQEANAEKTNTAMTAEIDEVRARQKGYSTAAAMQAGGKPDLGVSLSGKEAALAIKQIEQKYGTTQYAGYYQNEGAQLVDQGYQELAKIPPGASPEFWDALGAEVNKALKKQALASGEKWYGDSKMYSDSNFWYTFDPTTMKTLRPVVEAMAAVTKKFGLAEPTVDALQTWVSAEKGMDAFYQSQPANIKDVESGYFDPGVNKRAYLSQHPELKQYWDAKSAWQKDPANKAAMWFYYPDVYKKQYGDTPPTANWQGGPLVTAKTTAAPTTAWLAAPRGGGGGGGGARSYSSGGGSSARASTPFVSKYPATMPTLTPEQAQATFYASISDVTDPGLREAILSYYMQPFNSRLDFARRNTALAFWMAKQDPTRLAQLDALWRQLFGTPAKTYATAARPKTNVVYRARSFG